MSPENSTSLLSTPSEPSEWERTVRRHAASAGTRVNAKPRHRRRTLLNYPGAKSRVLDPLFAATPEHDLCVEVFGGSAIYTYSKPRSRIEVVNDLDDETHNVFKVMRDYPDKLASLMAAAPRSRALFDELAAQDPRTLSEVRRAFRCLYMTAHGFCCGQQRKPYFPANRSSNQRTGSVELAETIFQWAARYNRVTLECLDFEECIAKYDGEKTFFFIDPPYPEREHLYRTTFATVDHARLADALRRIKGKALVTLPDREDVREMYNWAASIRPLPIRYTMSGTSKKTDELLIFVNYTPVDDARPN